MIGIISGSGFYDFMHLENVVERIVGTDFGNVDVVIGNIAGVEVVFLSRHGKGHEKLPNHINYRASMAAMKKLGVDCVISATVCGILDPSVPLGRPIVFNDLFFPDNRLPNGELCSMFYDIAEKGRGHYIFSSPFSGVMRAKIKKMFPNVLELVYAHANGPRFNSRSEIKMFRSYAGAISQTAGPEVVLAGELEIPILLLGYGVDYANGVCEEPTSMEVLNGNLANSKGVFIDIITAFIEDYDKPSFEGFVYRFD